MTYILQSAYNDKLYHQIKSRGAFVEYTNINDFHLLNEDDIVIIDIFLHESELRFFKENINLGCICMSDVTYTNENIMFISKYQSIDAIFSWIFDHENQLIAIIGGSELFQKVQLECQNCNFIDFTYNPDSELSLIEILDERDTELIKKMRNPKYRILYLISNLMDLFNPPLRYLEPLIINLKKIRNTIIYIDYLKGPLDLMLLNHSDLIIIVHENFEENSKRYDSAIEKIVCPKKIISLNTNTKAYDQFKLSEHMLL